MCGIKWKSIIPSWSTVYVHIWDSEGQCQYPWPDPKERNYTNWMRNQGKQSLNLLSKPFSLAF